MRGSGSTAWHSPACATAPGIPQTTLVASSCATAPPPASTTRRVPASPSWPMPVSIATSTRPSQAAAALRSIGSTDGRQKFSGGSVVRRACRPPRACVHQQMPIAGREIDAAGLQRLAILRLGARQAAQLGDVLGQDRREGRRHVLRQDHRHVQCLAEPLHQREQRLRSAGRTADRQQARRADRRAACRRSAGRLAHWRRGALAQSREPFHLRQQLAGGTFRRRAPRRASARSRPHRAATRAVRCRRPAWSASTPSSP